MEQRDKGHDRCFFWEHMKETPNVCLRGQERLAEGSDSQDMKHRQQLASREPVQKVRGKTGYFPGTEIPNWWATECTAESGKVGRKQEPAHEGLFKEVRQ